jgi:hypothetical protein
MGCWLGLKRPRQALQAAREPPSVRRLSLEGVRGVLWASQSAKTRWLGDAYRGLRSGVDTRIPRLKRG